MPELVIDRREITEARFVRPTLLYEMGFRNRVGAYLRRTCDRGKETEATKAADQGEQTLTAVAIDHAPSGGDVSLTAGAVLYGRRTASFA